MSLTSYRAAPPRAGPELPEGGAGLEAQRRPGEGRLSCVLIVKGVGLFLAGPATTDSPGS